MTVLAKAKKLIKATRLTLQSRDCSPQTRKTSKQTIPIEVGYIQLNLLFISKSSVVFM